MPTMFFFGFFYIIRSPRVLVFFFIVYTTKNEYLFFLFCLFQREAETECRPDPLAADQNKQTTVAVSYVLTEYVCNNVLQYASMMLAYHIIIDQKVSCFLCRSFVEV